MKTLRRRLDHLDRRIDARPGGYSGDSYDVAEAFALQWAMHVTAAAIETGQVYALEERELEELVFVDEPAQEGDEDGDDR